MGGQVVKNDNVSLIQRWSELRLDVLNKGVAIQWSVDHPWRGWTVMTQARDKSQRFPMPMRNAGDQPPASQTASAQPCHLGVNAGLINEHNLADQVRARIQPGLAAAPHSPFGLDVAAFLLTGVCSFFYK